MSKINILYNFQIVFIPYFHHLYYLERLFENQVKIKTSRDFWNFAEEDLLKGLYWEELYNKGRRKTNFRCPSTDELATEPCPVAPTDR